MGRLRRPGILLRLQHYNNVLIAIYLDMGTTNTRAWLAEGARVVARASRPVGVRDTARSGSKAIIHAALAEIVKHLGIVASEAELRAPQCVIAAGMSSSSLGLAELPHAEAPAGIPELAASSRWFSLPEVTDLPIFLVPGVRSNPESAALNSIADADVMRGEETLCVGLISLGLVEPPALVLNLGSHWKAIQIDAEGRIAASITTLSGELIHAAQTQTILASSIFNEPVDRLDQQWVAAGMREERRSGLPRAMFCARLFDLAGDGTPKDRLAFVIGAFIAADLHLFISRGFLPYNTRSVIAGSAALARAWSSPLEAMSVQATVLAPAEVDDALLAGLRAIFLQSS